MALALATKAQGHKKSHVACGLRHSNYAAVASCRSAAAICSRKAATMAMPCPAFIEKLMVGRTGPDNL